MSISKFAPLFVDVAGQGLIIPILNTLILDPGTDYLRAETPQSSRHFYYGLVIRVFYLSWFLGAVYNSKLSDSIGPQARHSDLSGRRPDRLCPDHPGHRSGQSLADGSSLAPGFRVNFGVWPAQPEPLSLRVSDECNVILAKE